MTVAEFLVKILVNHGVKQLYGIPGDAINDIMEAVRTTDGVDFVQVKHEEAGALAASVQAKLTGQLTACVGTSGPGAIHLLNGLYDAKLDHAPVLAITGQVDTQYIGTNYHQEVDLERLFSDVAVYSQTLTNPEQFPDVILEACRAAIAHRGVAHLSIPSNIAGKSLSLSMEEVSEMAFAGSILPAAGDCEEAIELLNSSRKTAILAGIGAASAKGELLALAERIQAPIVRTLRAKSVIDDDHPLCAGGIGLLGGRPAVQAFNDCETLLMIGTDFPYKDFYPKNAKVIQIDMDARQIGKRHPVDVGLVGDAKSVLKHLLNTVEENPNNHFLIEAQAQMEKWRKRQASAETSDDQPIKPQRLVREIGEHAPDNAIFVCDTGTTNAWTARHLRVKPSQMFTLSACLGTMGVALPGAIGAQFAFPERSVYAIAGDGGFSMTLTDLSTAVHYKLPLKIIILNNSKLGFIELEQGAKGLPSFGIELSNPDFVALAKAFGCGGEKVERAEDIKEALQRATAHTESPYVIDVQVNPDELIIPPKIELSQAVNFAKAKVRKWLD